LQDTNEISPSNYQKFLTEIVLVLLGFY